MTNIRMIIFMKKRPKFLESFLQKQKTFLVNFKEIIEFRDERKWTNSDTPSNLSKSIIIEAAELLENFQWSDEPSDLQNVKEEIADVLIYAIAMAHDLGFDIEKIIDEKYLSVEFIEPEWSIAPGQTAAFYDGNRLLGGGFICQ